LRRTKPVTDYKHTLDHMMNLKIQAWVYAAEFTLFIIFLLHRKCLLTKEASEKWLTRKQVRLATPEELANYYGK
jgi:hypothetical protein